MTKEGRIIMWLRSQYGEGNENVQIVISALKKQIPIKPIPEYEDICGRSLKSLPNLYTRENYACPRCGVAQTMFFPYSFCPKCGQRINWMP